MLPKIRKLRKCYSFTKNVHEMTKSLKTSSESEKLWAEEREIIPRRFTKINVIISHVSIWHESNKLQYSAAFPCVMKKVNCHDGSDICDENVVTDSSFSNFFRNLTTAYLVSSISHSFHRKTNFNSSFSFFFKILYLQIDFYIDLIYVISLSKSFELTAAIRGFHV